MNTFNTLILASVFALGSQAAVADRMDERNIDKLVNGNLSAKKSASESIYHTNEQDRETLDVATEVLLQNYASDGNRKAGVDTYAWMCKAVGQSGSPRYHEAIAEVAENATQKKLRRHCKKALKSLPQGSADSYTRGAVSLAQYEKEPTPVNPQMDHLSETGKETLAGGEHPFDLVAEGMSMEEVHVVVGYPTNTTSKITGKAFIPFYRGGDTGRMHALYKGLGRIEYTRKGAYSSTMRVLNITEDATEVGYP